MRLPISCGPKTRAFFTAIAVFPLIAASAGSSSDISPKFTDSLPDNPSFVIGMTLDDAYQNFGPPDGLACVRGAEPWQDDVVFIYGTFTLSWFDAHVWRIGFHKGYKGTVYGLFLGDTLAKAVSLLGEPSISDESHAVFNLPHEGFPLSLGMSLENGRTVDIYVYRSDI